MRRDPQPVESLAAEPIRRGDAVLAGKLSRGRVKGIKGTGARRSECFLVLLRWLSYNVKIVEKIAKLAVYCDSPSFPSKRHLKSCP